MIRPTATPRAVGSCFAELLAEMAERLEDPAAARHRVITWSSPVPSFGNSAVSQVATLGLNPSSREFMDGLGRELDGSARRLHTLKSLGLRAWSEAGKRHLHSVWEACSTYFCGNPYDTWFKSLDQLISGTGCSYYDPDRSACHLDLIPYATTCKWTELTQNARAGLLSLAGDTLGLVLRASSVKLVVLNGQSVVDNLQRLADLKLARQTMPEWKLPRASGVGVQGIAYSGVITQIGNISLGRRVQILGYNHNIQSSFGVTNDVKCSIRNWLTHQSQEMFK